MLKAIQVVLGLLNIVVSIPSIVLHALVFVAIMQSTMYRRRIAFQIMLTQTIVNTSQLLLQSAASFHSVFNISINERLNLVMGIMIDMCWATSLYLQFLLSVNRFSIMTLKSSESKFERKLMQLLLITTGIAGIASGSANKMVESGLTFKITSLSWTMPTEERHPIYVAIYNTQLFFLTCTYVICILIVCSLIYRRRRYALERTLIRPIEARIFVQTSIESLMSLSSIYLWDAANGFSEEYVIALVNFQWVLICALPPYLTIALIDGLRNSIRNTVKAIITVQQLSTVAPIYQDYCAENCGKSAFLWRQLRLDFSFNDSSCLPIQQQLACHSSLVVYCKIPQRTEFPECLGFANISMGNFYVSPANVLVPRFNQSVLNQLGIGTYLLANQLIAQCPRCRIKSKQFQFSNDSHGCYSLLQTQTPGWPFQFHTCDLVTNQANWNNSTKCPGPTINVTMPEGAFIPVFPSE